MMLAGMIVLILKSLGATALSIGVVRFFFFHRNAVSDTHAANLNDDPGAIGAVLAVLALVALCYISPPGAGDDVLRDIASGAYGFDYHRMYPNADIPRYNAYIAFDRLFSWLAGAIGGQGTLHIIQAAAMLAYLWLFVLLARQSADRLRAEHYALIGLALATPLSARIFLARPEVWFTAWGLYGALATTRRRIGIWIAVGALLTTGYWLAPLYFPFIVLIKARCRAKIILGVLLLSLHVAFWCVISHGTYLESLNLLSIWPRHRVASIGETANATLLLLDPYILVMIFLTGVSCTSRTLRQSDFKILTLFGYFLLSGMIRYVAVWVGLLFILVLPWLEIVRVQSRWQQSVLLVFPLFCSFAVFENAIPMTALPNFSLPSGAYVLTSLSTATFALPFFNSGKIAIAPSMELGANTIPVQTLAADLTNGSLDCAKLKVQPFTHVVENQLRTLPVCLRLIAIDGSWREWEVLR